MIPDVEKQVLKLLGKYFKKFPAPKKFSTSETLVHDAPRGISYYLSAPSVGSEGPWFVQIYYKQNIPHPQTVYVAPPGFGYDNAMRFDIKADTVYTLKSK